MKYRDDKDAMTKPAKSAQANRKSLISQVSRRTSHNNEALWSREYIRRRQRQTSDSRNTKPLMEGKTSDIHEFQTLDSRDYLKLWECKTTETRDAKHRSPGTTSESKNTIPQRNHCLCAAATYEYDNGLSSNATEPPCLSIQH